MKKRFIIVIVLLVGLGCFFASYLLLRTVFVHRTKLEESDYASYAYKIAPGKLSEKSRKALDGFSYKMTPMSDGSILAEFIPHRSWYRYYTLTVKPGYSLYFLEKDDDSTSAFEKFLNDDHPFLVDPQGYIVE